MQSENTPQNGQRFNIAMLSLHSSPLGPLGTRDTGGMSVYVREIARWLGGAGHRIDIFTCAGDSPPEIEICPNVRLITLGGGRFAHFAKAQLPQHLPDLAQAVEQFCRERGLSYDLIHSHYWISGVVGAMLQSQWRVPHLTMFHTLGAAKNRDGSGENESALRIGHERWLVAAADRIIAPSSGELDHLVTQYRAPREKIAVVPCGVDLELFRPRQRLAARQTLGIAPDAQVVLFVGRFAPLKGLDALIQAVGAVRARHPRLQLMVVGGDGPRDEDGMRLRRRLDQQGLGHMVRFNGRVDQIDLPEYYSAADLLALPSHYESFGLVVLEALACGTPVAATAVGAAADLVQEGLNGVLIPAPDARSVAATIDRFFETLSDRHTSIAKVRASVESFGWQGVAATLAQLYHALITDPGHANAGAAQRVAGGL